MSAGRSQGSVYCHNAQWRKLELTLVPVLTQLEKDLLLEVPKWEEQHNRVFLVNGVSLMEELEFRMQAETEARPPSRVSV